MNAAGSWKTLVTNLESALPNDEVHQRLRYLAHVVPAAKAGPLIERGDLGLAGGLPDDLEQLGLALQRRADGRGELPQQPYGVTCRQHLPLPGLLSPESGWRTRSAGVGRKH